MLIKYLYKKNLVVVIADLIQLDATIKLVCLEVK